MQLDVFDRGGDTFKSTEALVSSWALMRQNASMQSTAVMLSRVERMARHAAAAVECREAVVLLRLTGF
jgi:hypothetical protein